MKMNLTNIKTHETQQKTVFSQNWSIETWFAFWNFGLQCHDYLITLLLTTDCVEVSVQVF